MYDLSILPNEEGYKFKGIKKDYSYEECIVSKDLMGMHTSCSLEDGRQCYFELIGWRPLKQ